MRYKLVLSLAAGMIVAAVLFSSQQHAISVITVNPRNSFGVSASSGQAKLVAVYGRGANLYFLFTGGNRETPGELVRTDTDGTVQLRVPLPLTEMTYRHVRAAPNGVMAVLASGHSAISALVYDAAGKHLTSITPFNKPYDIQFMGPTLLGIGYQYVESLYDIDSSKPAFPGPVSVPSVTPFWSASLTNDLIAILSATNGVMQLVSRNGAVSQPIELSAPEMQRRPGTESGDEALVHTLASAATGDIYCGLTGYPVTAGGMIARFDKTGKPKGSIRCVLPKFQELVKPKSPASRYSNPTGYLFPEFLAVTDVPELKIYWADSLGRKVVSYVIDK